MEWTPFGKKDSETIEYNFQNQVNSIEMILGPNKDLYRIEIRDRYQTLANEEGKFRAIKRGTEQDPKHNFI